MCVPESQTCGVSSGSWRRPRISAQEMRFPIAQSSRRWPLDRIDSRLFGCRGSRDRRLLRVLGLVAAGKISGLVGARHEISLAVFAFLLTRINSGFAGRAYAAYGGVYIASSLEWLWLVEDQTPDRWDIIGGVVCLTGAAVVLWGPRPAWRCHNSSQMDSNVHQEKANSSGGIYGGIFGV